MRHPTSPGAAPFASQSLSRRTLLKALGLTAAAGGLAACAPSAGGTAASGSAPGLTKDSTKAFTFTSWSMNEEASKAQLQGLIDAWSSSAGVTIDTPSFPYNDYLKQLILQLKGDQTTGVVQMDIAWLANAAALGKFADISSFVTDAGYADYTLKTGQYKGTQVGLPWSIGAIGMVGNTELLDKAGMTEPPETLEEFEALLAELKKLGNGVVPYAAMTKVANLKDIVPWMWTFGSPVVKDGEITVGDDQSIEALTWYKKMYDAGLIGQDLDRFDARALFGQGKVGIYEDAPAARKFVSTNATDAKIGEKLTAFGRPVLESGQPPQALSWGQVLCVVDSDGGYAAAEFAKHISSDTATVLEYFTKAGYPPTTDTALKDPAFIGDSFAKEFATRITPTAKTDELWQFSQSALMYEALATQVQAVLIGDATPKEAAQQAKTDMDKLKD